MEVDNIESVEVDSPLTFDDFKKKSLYCLLLSIRNNYKANWSLYPYTEKYYHCARQSFIKRYSKCGGNPIDGFKLIYRVLNLKRGEKVRNIFSEEMSDELETVLQYFN